MARQTVSGGIWMRKLQELELVDCEFALLPAAYQCTRCSWQFRSAVELPFISRGRLLLPGTSSNVFFLFHPAKEVILNQNYISAEKVLPHHPMEEHKHSKTGRLNFTSKNHRSEVASDVKRCLLETWYFSEHALADLGRCLEGKSLQERKRESGYVYTIYIEIMHLTVTHC